MKIQRIEEYKINNIYHIQILELLKMCFSSYPSNQSLYKQFPSFRFLAFEEKKLVAHLAIIHRLIKIGGENAIIFGVSDLCVHPDFQNKKIASTFLDKLESLGKKHQINFITLIAQDQNLYKKNGFQKVNNNCRWLIINETQSLGVVQRNLDGALMIKALTKKRWGAGIVDFQGCLF